MNFLMNFINENKNFKHLICISYFKEQCKLLVYINKYLSLIQYCLLFVLSRHTTYIQIKEIITYKENDTCMHNMKLYIHNK